MIKSCPKCKRTYPDEGYVFCLEDGTLLSAPFESRDPEPGPSAVVPPPTEILIAPTVAANASQPLLTTVAAPIPQVPPVKSDEAIPAENHVMAPKSSAWSWGVPAVLIAFVAVIIGFVAFISRLDSQLMRSTQTGRSQLLVNNDRNAQVDKLIASESGVCGLVTAQELENATGMPFVNEKFETREALEGQEGRCFKRFGRNLDGDLMITIGRFEKPEGAASWLSVRKSFDGAHEISGIGDNAVMSISKQSPRSLGLAIVKDNVVVEMDFCLCSAESLKGLGTKVVSRLP